MKKFIKGNIQRKLLSAMIISFSIPLIITSVLILVNINKNTNDTYDNVKWRIEDDLVYKVNSYWQSINESSANIYTKQTLLSNMYKYKNSKEKEDLLSKNKEEINEILLDIYKNLLSNHVQAIYLLTEDNKMLGNFYTSWPAGFGGVSKEYLSDLKSGIDGGSMDTPNVYFNYKSSYGFPVIQYVYPIFAQGQIVGYIIIDLNEDKFSEMVENYNKSHNGIINIYNSNNNVLYRSNVSEEQVNRALNLNNVFSIDSDIDFRNWKLKYTYELDPNTIITKYATYIMILVSSLIALIISLKLSKNLTYPIVELNNSIRSFKHGKYDTRVDIKTDDEIEELGNQFNSMATRIQKLIEKDFKLQLVNKETEIKALQAQISPHFLNNTLQVMSSIAEIENIPSISIMCTTLSNMYKYNMNLSKKWVTISEEILHIRNYMLIINKRFPKIINFKISIDREGRKFKIPKLILQPIIENAITHGLSVSDINRKLLKISFSVDKEKNILYIRVIDNGRGMKKEKLDKINCRLRSSRLSSYMLEENNGSIGIYNVQARIMLLCGEGYYINILSKNNKGTCVTYILPLVKEDQ